MLLTAGLLLLLAAGHFAIWQTRPGPKLAVGLALAAATGCGWATQARGMVEGTNVREIYRGNSNFGQLQVLESRFRPRRALLNDYLLQGAYDTQAQQSAHMFSYMLHDLARAYTTNLSDVLCIGLGVGLVPRQFAREGARVDVVEINPAMVPLAQQYFGFQPEKVNLTIGDGRQFLTQCRQRYDAIILDAFQGETTPSHLMTREAFTAIRRRLRPDGVLVINCFGDFTLDRDFQAASLQKTLTNVFPSVCLHADSDTNEVANVFFVAANAQLAVRRPPAFDLVHPACRGVVAGAFARVVVPDPAHGRVLTDNFNPVEYYDAANRERLRRSLVDYVREM